MGSDQNSGSGSQQLKPSAIPSLPSNVSIFSPADKTVSKALLNGSIFSRINVSPQPGATSLPTALKSLGQGFCLTHRDAILVFDAPSNSPDEDLQDRHHEHVRQVCLALKDMDIGVQVAQCVWDAATAVQAGFQLEGLNSGDVMVVDIMGAEDDDDDDDDDASVSLEDLIKDGQVEVA